jgi:DNA-binding transcriptional MerR regulator
VGSYRLYDSDDLGRLRFIKGLRDDAGFSLAEIATLLEDEEVRSRVRVRLRVTTDHDERQAIVDDALARIDRQISMLSDKLERIHAMIEEANARRDRHRRAELG